MLKFCSRVYDYHYRNAHISNCQQRPYMIVDLMQVDGQICAEIKFYLATMHSIVVTPDGPGLVYICSYIYIIIMLATQEFLLFSRCKNIAISV